MTRHGNQIARISARARRKRRTTERGRMTVSNASQRTAPISATLNTATTTCITSVIDKHPVYVESVRGRLQRSVRRHLQLSAEVLADRPADALACATADSTARSSGTWLGLPAAILAGRVTLEFSDVSLPSADASWVRIRHNAPIPRKPKSLKDQDFPVVRLGLVRPQQWPRFCCLRHHIVIMDEKRIGEVADTIDDIKDNLYEAGALMTSTTPRSLENVKQIAEDVVAGVSAQFVVVGVTSGEANGSYTEVMVGSGGDHRVRSPIVIGVARNDSEADLRHRIALGLRQQLEPDDQ